MGKRRQEIDKRQEIDYDNFLKVVMSKQFKNLTYNDKEKAFYFEMPCNSKKSDNFLGVVRYGDHKEYYCQISDLDSFLSDLVESLINSLVHQLRKKFTFEERIFPISNKYRDLNSFLYSKLLGKDD